MAFSERNRQLLNKMNEIYSENGLPQLREIGGAFVVIGGRCESCFLFAENSPEPGRLFLIENICKLLGGGFKLLVKRF